MYLCACFFGAVTISVLNKQSCTCHISKHLPSGPVSNTCLTSTLGNINPYGYISSMRYFFFVEYSKKKLPFSKSVSILSVSYDDTPIRRAPQWHPGALSFSRQMPGLCDCPHGAMLSWLRGGCGFSSHLKCQPGSSPHPSPLPPLRWTRCFST